MHKAYYRVEWRFLENMLIRLGFHQNFVELMMACVRSVKYKVRYNDQERQGDEVHPRQCPCLRAFVHGAYVGAGRFDGFRQKQGYIGIYPGSAPRRVKTYIVLV
jgi:hypothetical protein